MLVREFDYHLPPELIARTPAPERDGSRLMLLDRTRGTIAEDRFRNIAEYLQPGDLLVLNDTRVIPARLLGHKSTGGRVEIFLVRRDPGPSEVWTCMLRSGKGIRPGQVLLLPSAMHATVLRRDDAMTWSLEFTGDEPFAVWLEREGAIPLPPYLQRPADASDRERYQTIFARTPGAVAAPTAGLHFSARLLDELAHREVAVACITLHTGLGTFQPVRVERVEDHQIHTERFSISRQAVEAIEAARKRGGRVIAVGTTTARTLEYAAGNDGTIHPGSGEADIFIYPGYTFRAVDALITNFHLPESTLLMLVSAFAGRVLTRQAYEEAIRRRFRFYSYGDAMFIS